MTTIRPTNIPGADSPASSLTASPSSVSDAKKEKTWKAAQDFEAKAINEMLAPMFETEGDANGGVFGGGIGEKQFKPMLINEFAKNMQKAGGLGLAPAIYQKMLELQEKK